MLFDYRFRPNPRSQIGVNQKKGQDNDEKFEDAASFFFADKNGRIPREINLKKVDRVYNEYMNVLSRNYETLKTKYQRFINDCLDDD